MASEISGENSSVNVIIKSASFAARPIRGSMKISQAIRIPPVILPEKEEVILPKVPARLIRTWTPFGSGKLTIFFDITGVPAR